MTMDSDLVIDLERYETVILPECVINAWVWCCEGFDNIVVRCVRVYTRASTWCHKKILKYEREVDILLKCIGIFMYILDFGTDSFTSVKYISSGKIIAGSLSITFTILPMLFLSFRMIIYASLDSQNSTYVKLIPSLSAVVCSPIMPLGWLVLDLVASLYMYNSNNINNDNTISITEATRLTASKAASLLKLFVAVVESFPQATIQLFIVFGSLAAGELVELWQWVSIATSLISLSLSVSTGYLNIEAGISSKFIYFLFGLLAVGSRLVVCCVYSIHYPVLGIVPFCTQLTTSIITWIISSMWKGQWNGFPIFVLTEAYNSFTLSGLLTSSINLGFAVGGLFLLEVKPGLQSVLNKLLIVSVVLASISWVFNIVFSVVPQCKGIRMDWMRKRDVETTQPDAEGASTVAKESHTTEDVLTFVTETQLDAENTPANDNETQPNFRKSLSDTDETKVIIHETLPDAQNIQLDEMENASYIEETYL